MPQLIKDVNYEDSAVKYRGERVLSLLRKLNVGEDLKLPSYIDTDFAISVYYAMFLPYPVLNESVLNEADEKTRKQYHLLNFMLSSRKVHEVRKNTIADTASSMVAAAVFLDALVKELRRRSRSQAGGAKAGSDREQQSRESLEQAVERALEAASEYAKQAKEITNLAMRFAAGTGSMLSLDDSIAEVMELAKNTDVKVILEALKSIQDIEGYVKRKLVRSPRGELDGYETGSDVERVVISELALPKDFFLVKFVESSLLLYRKVLHESKGPFYVLLDKSGSMMGLKIIWAKAVALALAQRAVREHREFYVRFFDSIPYPPLKLGKRVRGRDVIKLLEYVARVRANGGTDITRAIITAAEDIMVSGNRYMSDIVLITDGEDRITVEAVKRSLARAKARLHTVMIHGNNPDLRMVSETYMTVTKLSREEALQVIAVKSD
jgi:uncharacterized protein with von Willebrand factor type A (vWA) domain